MTKNTFSKYVRRTHLFLALFLSPWILMYALSTLAMHHRALFTGEQRRIDPEFEVIRQESYTAPFSGDVDRETASRRILEDLNIEGAFNARGSLEEGTLTITRNRPIGTYRVTYDAGQSQLLVERQKFGMTFFLEMMHRRRGYQQPFIANDLWAFIVDSVLFTILLWAATGLWMWWEMTRTRMAGAICLGAGAAFFLLFLAIL